MNDTNDLMDDITLPIAAVLADIRRVWMSLAGCVGPRVDLPREMMTVLGESLAEQIDRIEVMHREALLCRADLAEAKADLAAARLENDRLRQQATAFRRQAEEAERAATIVRRFVPAHLRGNAGVVSLSDHRTPG